LRDNEAGADDDVFDRLGDEYVCRFCSGLVPLPEAWISQGTAHEFFPAHVS